MTGEGRGAESSYRGGAAGAASALRIVWRDQPLRRLISRIDQPSRARSLMNSTSTILSTAFLLPARPCP